MVSDLFLKTETARLADLARWRVREALRRANAPLRGRVDQRPCDCGLFSDEANQTDWIDEARK